MEEKEIEERAKKVVSSILGVDEEKIKSESRFVEDLGAESVASLELVAGFEEEFDIEMDENAALEVKTFGDAVKFIKKYVEAK